MLSEYAYSYQNYNNTYNCTYPNISAIEYSALRSFYYSTSGPSWNCDEFDPGWIPWNFSSGENPCGPNTWKGVECKYECYTCGSNGKSCEVNNTIILLNIQLCNLRGPIPSEIGVLSNIEGLYLDQNSLSGSIPSELAYLNLDILNLYGNYFSDSLPTSLGLLTNLEYFLLGSNLLNGTIPSQLSGMSSVYYLDVSFNSLSGPIPSEIALLHPTLQFLSFGHNQLTSTIPSSFVLCSNLQILSLFTNLLTGTIPAEFHLLWNIFEIDVNQNLLTGTIPQFISNLTILAVLNLGNNMLTGPVPNGFKNITMLDSVALGLNYLTSTIPIDFAELYHMQTLSMNNNYFTGSIPSTLGLYQAPLFSVYVGSNSLTGSFPQCLWRYLESLDVSQNKLTGTLPPIPNNTKAQLGLLGVDQNQFSGTIPPSLASMPLQILNLGSNKFEGNLSTVASIQSLIAFSAFGNYFTGTVPTAITTSKITQIIISNNFLTGTLPAEISSMSNLQTILVQRNFLQGQPDTIFNVTGQLIMTAVDLSFNDFTGTIPSEVFKLPVLGTFAAVKTCFHGPLPLTICNSTSLKVLLLDGVASGAACQKPIHFIGTASNAYYSTNGPVPGGIPSCIWALPQLQSLQLTSNGLTGTVAAPPLSSSLLDVVLSYNQLSGTIPMALQNLPLQVLKLSNNRFKGTYEGISANYNPSFALNIHNNRLSGFLPSSLMNASNVDAMQGNLFNCNGPHPKPPHDLYGNVTSCGSSPLNDSLVVWGISIVSMLLVALVFLRFVLDSDEDPAGSYVVQWLSAAWLSSPIHDCLAMIFGCCCASTDSKYLSHSPEMKMEKIEKMDISTLPVKASTVDLINYSNLLRQCARTSSKLMGVVVVLGIPIYGGLKSSSSYSTHTFEYNWLVSSAFMSGYAPAALVLTMWIICSAIVLVDSAQTYSVNLTNAVTTTAAAATATATASATAAPQAQNNRKANPDTQFTAEENAASKVNLTEVTAQSVWGSAYLYAFAGAVLTILVTAIVGANALYLYIILSSDFTPAAQTAAELGLAFFKFIWNVSVIPAALATIRFQPCHSPPYTNDPFNSSPGSHEQQEQRKQQDQQEQQQYGDSGSLRQNVQLRFFCFVFNNVIAPVIVTIFADTSCVYNLVVPEASITEVFKYHLAALTQCFTVPQNITDYFNVNAPVQPKFCYTFSSALQLVNTFYPPFTYGYQCSSAVLTNYVPVLIYSYTMQAVLLPVLYFSLFSYFVRVDKRTARSEPPSLPQYQPPSPSPSPSASASSLMPASFYPDPRTHNNDTIRASALAVSADMPSCDDKSFQAQGRNNGSDHGHAGAARRMAERISMRLKGIVRPLSTLALHDRLLASSTAVASLMQSLLVLLTFGAASPPVAAAVLVSVVSQVVENLLLIDVYLTQSPRCRPNSCQSPPCSDYLSPTPDSNSAKCEGDERVNDSQAAAEVDLTGGLNEACRGVWRVPGSLIWWLVHISSVFWAMMIFDMVGDMDANNPTIAGWSALATVSLPIAARLLLLMIPPLLGQRLCTRSLFHINTIVTTGMGSRDQSECCSSSSHSSGVTHLSRHIASVGVDVESSDPAALINSPFNGPFPVREREIDPQASAPTVRTSFNVSSPGSDKESILTRGLLS